MGQGGGNNCSTNALCIDTLTGFNCSCNLGFYGDGVNCTGIVFFPYFCWFNLLWF